MMKTLLFILLVAEIFATTIILGFKMKTSRHDYEKKFRWTLEGLEQLPGVVMSLPFSPVKNSSWTWNIVLKLANGHVSMFLDHFDAKYAQHRRGISVHGNVAFKNSTHHLIARETFQEGVIVSNTQTFLMQVPTFTWIEFAVGNFNRAVNGTLILDFSFNITAPVTIFEHPGRHSITSF